MWISQRMRFQAEDRAVRTARVMALKEMLLLLLVVVKSMRGKGQAVAGGVVMR